MRNLHRLFNLVFLGGVLVMRGCFGAEDDKEQVRQALESRSEDITELSDFWNCISTQVIRDKFSWNRIHRIGRYDSMPINFPSTMKEKLQSIDILDPRNFYMGCVGILKLLESKRIITSGYEDEFEKVYSRKTFCISAAEYCFPVKGRLKVVKDYFTKVAESAREAILESKEREISEKEREEMERLTDRADLKLLQEDPDFGKPQHHPLMEEKILSRRAQKNRLNLPELGKDLQVQLEFLETALEEVPPRVHRVQGGDEVVATEIDYNLLPRVSLHNLPPEHIRVSKGAWNFWKSILLQERRDDSFGNRRLSILTQNFPVELKDFTYSPKKLLLLCNKTLFSLLRRDLLEVSDSALSKSKESPVTQDARSRNEQTLQEFVKLKSLDADQPYDPENDSMDYIDHQFVIFEFCTDSVDIFIGNRQWNKIVERQNHRIYGLPSGRPIMPFKFTFGRDIYEMRSNCASCIWDLYVNKVSKDIYIDGNTRSGKFDISLLKKNIESFCHFSSVSFFQGELSLDDQQSCQSGKDRGPRDADSAQKYNPMVYNFESRKQEEEELESYEQARPEKQQFLESPLDEEVHKVSCKTSPTGYHEFKSNESLNRPLVDQKNSRLLFASTRTVDEILDQGVPVGLTVGETNQKTLKYTSLYKISPRESLVAFQQWRAITLQTAVNAQNNRHFSVSDLPLDQPREWNTPQYSSEKFLFVCIELLSSLLSLSKIKVNLPHGAELDDYRDKARDVIKTFCREATNRYFLEYVRMFDVMSATSKGKPLMDESKVSSKWSIIQEQVILDYISGLENRVAEVSPMLPRDFSPATERLDFEYQCIGAIYQGYVSTPPKVIIRTKPGQDQEGRSQEEIKEELDGLIRGFCKRASKRYYTAVEYLAMYAESLNWLDPRAKNPYSISSHSLYNPDSTKTGSIQGIPWPPIKLPSALVYTGRARPDLYRDSCFSYIWRVWESGVARSLYIDGTSFERCKSLDTAKVILEEFCTASSAKLYRLEPGTLLPREVLQMEQRALVGVARARGRTRRTVCEPIGDGLPKRETGYGEEEQGVGESGVALSDMDEQGETDTETEAETESATSADAERAEEEDFKTEEKREAKRQWDQLRQQLKRDVNMNFIRFVKLPEYDQTLYTLWSHPVTETAFVNHCVKVLDELLKLRLAVLSGHSLKDREYTIERFCDESKFYVFSDVQEKINDEDLGGLEGDPDRVERKVQQELLDTLKELSEEGYPLYKWLESVMNLKSSSDRETLSKAIKWGQRKGDWHFLELVLKEVDRDLFMSIQKHLQGISPQGFLMTSGLFDRETTVSIEATWGAIYLQSLKDIKSGSPRVVGLVGSPPPREIWSGANNEQEFVLLCAEAIKKLKVNPPFVVIDSQGQDERSYIQNFCEDAMDTLMAIQRDPERILSMDFAYSGCVNEAMRKWQWNQIYTQMDIDLRESGEYRITGIPPAISHKIYKGGKTQDEVEDQCGDALEELDKRNKIKILNKNASQFCRDAAENICKEDEGGKSNCNIERARLEEIISQYHMDTPIGNPLKLDSRTRCMRIWTLLKNSVPSALKKNIISTVSMAARGGGGIGMEDLELGLGGDIVPPSVEGALGGGMGSSFDGNIRFIALREIMDVCSPIDTPSNIIGVFVQAMRKIERINSLRSSDERLYGWVRELVIRYFADERTDHEYLDLTGVNVFGDPYSKEGNSLDVLNKGLHSRGIPKRVRELTDNEKAVMREKESMRINSIVDGIVSQVLPSIAHLTTKEKKREITDKALHRLQREIEEREMLLNRQLGSSEISEMVKTRPELPAEEKGSIALGKVQVPIILARGGIGRGGGDDLVSSGKGSEKVIARLDTRWDKLGGDQIVRLEKIKDQEKTSRQLSKNIERSFRKLDSEWASIRTFKSYVLLNIPKDRPSEYGDKGYKDLFNKEAMIRRCVNFFSDEKYRANYGISIKGNYIERASHIRTHCSRSASRIYDLLLSSRSTQREDSGRARRKHGQGRAVHRAGRLIHVKGESEPLHQIVSRQRIVSGNVVEESEISPEELEGSQSPPAHAAPRSHPSVEIQHVGSNDGYKAISSEYISKGGTRGRGSHRRKKSQN